ncbi:hypothetical protein [Microvirga rosea]|uniref:hypothetical protein n=1 Tax=Microvirga rosea TaxID=2715425 RepID=UPI001D0B8305|nr:hypothetical protein [Microvirga rosea]MCB8822696.1 hypothetical protein [Microvirga rosea]
MDMLGGWLWALVVIGGPVLLGIALFLFSANRRKMTRREVQASEQSARENWGKERVR